MTEKTNVKDNFKKELEEDMNNSRGALREIIEHSRVINRKLVEELNEGDFTRIEELTMLQEGILKSVKLLNEINQTQPKTYKEIEEIKDQKSSINLEDLMDE